jgi:hypothetical protein
VWVGAVANLGAACDDHGLAWRGGRRVTQSKLRVSGCVCRRQLRQASWGGGAASRRGEPPVALKAPSTAGVREATGVGGGEEKMGSLKMDGAFTLVLIGERGSGRGVLLLLPSKSRPFAETWNLGSEIGRPC